MFSHFFDGLGEIWYVRFIHMSLNICEFHKNRLDKRYGFLRGII